MTFRPKLNGIPVELMEGIVALLELNDICSLRLTAGEVATKSSQGVFKSHFRTKTIKLTATEQLEEFVCMTQPKQLGCNVEYLTLVCRPVSPAQGAGKNDAAELLGQAMKNLRLNSARSCLPSLSLMTGIDGNGGRRWQSVWEAAAECFQITALALGASKLPIEMFDVFGRVTRCSLACDQIATVLEKFDLTASLKEVKQLSMSLSNHYVREPESEEMQSLTAGERNANAIGQFLELCPLLENLQLHWYSLYSVDLTDSLFKEQRFFDRIAESYRFPSLKRCTLKGIKTSEAALLSFLCQVNLSSLEMEEVLLDSGKFRPVFSFLAQHMEQLEHVHFDDLWEERLISFDAPGNPHFPGSGGCTWPNTLTRIGADARKPIKYRQTRGHSLGSPQANSWYRRKRLLYGPP